MTEDNADEAVVSPLRLSCSRPSLGDDASTSGATSASQRRRRNREKARSHKFSIQYLAHTVLRHCYIMTVEINKDKSTLPVLGEDIGAKEFRAPSLSPRDLSCSRSPAAENCPTSEGTVASRMDVEATRQLTHITIIHSYRLAASSTLMSESVLSPGGPRSRTDSSVQTDRDQMIDYSIMVELMKTRMDLIEQRNQNQDLQSRIKYLEARRDKQALDILGYKGRMRNIRRRFGKNSSSSNSSNNSNSSNSSNDHSGSHGEGRYEPDPAMLAWENFRDDSSSKSR